MPDRGRLVFLPYYKHLCGHNAHASFGINLEIHIRMRRIIRGVRGQQQGQQIARTEIIQRGRIFQMKGGEAADGTIVTNLDPITG